jgi:hypothetical protein
MHHEGQENSRRRLVWVERPGIAGWGCSKCAWAFNPAGLPSLPIGESLDELTRNLQALLFEEFASHACAELLQAKGTTPSA